MFVRCVCWALLCRARGDIAALLEEDDQCRGSECSLNALQSLAGKWSRDLLL